MPARKPNLWPFKSRKTAPKAKPARSSMTVGQAMRKAFQAGQDSGDTGLFGQWLESSGLSGRGNVLRARLKREYERGFETKFNEPPVTHTRQLSEHKGHQIEGQADGTFSVPSLDRDSRFDTIADAKKFIDSWRRNPKNPTDRALRYRANATPPAGRKGHLKKMNSMTVDGEAIGLYALLRRLKEDGRRYRTFRVGSNLFIRMWGESDNAAIRVEGADEHAKQMLESGANSTGRKRNPQAQAANLYESFHGKPSTETILVEETVHEHEHLATLGALIELVVETVTGLLATISFDEADSPWLAASEDGRQLYIEGGDQELDLASLKMDGEEWIKDRMVIGLFAAPEPRDKGRNRRKHNLTYRTKKEFDNFEEIDYQHDLGEETGVRPILMYAPRDKHLYIEGGQYRIEQPLIGTSPGIEN